MANSNFDGTMLPSYGNDSPVEPVEKGNIDLAANNYASALQKAALEGMMIYKDGSFYTLIPKVGPDGNMMEERKAIRLYRKTNGHFGRFYNDREAKMYSSWLRNKVAEVAKYFPDEAIVEITPDSAFTKGFLTKVALNKSILRHNIKQVLSYSKKSLGRPLRRASEPFDANAIDGDEDGIVQDGTMWARPAMPGKPIVASMRSGKNGNLFVSEDTKRAASKLLATLKKEEPAVTKNIEQIAQLSRGRAKLVDLDSRFKDVQSLGQKIERLKGNWNNNVAAAASEMNDGLRYTFVVPNNDDYSKFVSSTLSLLQGQGMKITAWNYWNSKDPYNGVNAMGQHRNGFNYEIQFHTPKSYADKKKLEPLYTKFRDEK